MDTMRGDEFRFEQSLLLHIRNDGHAIFVAHVFHFKKCLGQMGVKRDVEFLGKIGGFTEDLSGASIRRVRGNRGDDKRMILPLLDILTRLFHRIFIGDCVGRGKFEYGLSAHPAHACLGGCRRDIVLVKVHVIEGGHAASDQFSTCNGGSKPNELR